MSGEKEVIWFSDVKQFTPELGKKGYALAKLYQNRYPLSAGFIVSNKAYDNFISNNSFKEVMNAILLDVDKMNSLKKAEVYEKIQQLFSSGLFSSGFKEELDESGSVLGFQNGVQIISADPDVNYRSLPVHNVDELCSALQRCFAASFKNPGEIKNQSAIVTQLPRHNLQANLYSRYNGYECKLEISCDGKHAVYTMSKRPDLKLNCVEDSGNIIRLVSTQGLARMVFYARDLEKNFNCPQQVSFALDEKDKLTILDSKPYHAGRDLSEKISKEVEFSFAGFNKLNDMLPGNHENKLLNYHEPLINNEMSDSLHDASFLTKRMFATTMHHVLRGIVPEIIADNRAEIKEQKNERNSNEDLADYEQAILAALDKTSNSVGNLFGKVGL